MNKQSMSICFLVILAISLGLLVWGLMDLLQGKKKSEKEQNEVISRQLRGFGLIFLSQIVFVVGGIMCLDGGAGMKMLGL